MNARLGVDGNARRHKDLYWFGPLGSVIPYVQFVLLIYLALVCSRGYKWARKGRASQVFRMDKRRVSSLKGVPVDLSALVWLGQSLAGAA